MDADATVRESIHPPCDPRGFHPARPVYPGIGCKAGKDCRVCPRWKCPGCMVLRPWCFGANDGADDGLASLCDDCWYAAVHPEATKDGGG